MLSNLLPEFKAICDWLSYFVRYGEIPTVAFSIFPLFASFAAAYLGFQLLHKLKPGMVCVVSMGCDRCELLYSIGLGSFSFSLIYMIMEVKWIVTEGYNRISSLDELLWSSYEAAIMFFLAWISYRSINCLQAHKDKTILPTCKGRNHINLDN